MNIAWAAAPIISNQEESLAVILAVVAVIVLAAGFYILVNRFHLRPAQLLEVSLYALFALVAAHLPRLVFRSLCADGAKQTGLILLYL